MITVSRALSLFRSRSLLFEAALANLLPFHIYGEFGENYSLMYGLFSRTSCFLLRNSVCSFSSPSWRSFECDTVKILNLKFPSTRFRVQCYSTRKASGIKSPLKKKVDGKPKPALMKEEEDSFFVVRKGDLVGVYKSLSDCRAQVGSSICDPPVSVYKGYSMPKDTLEYLLSRGLKNALYSIRAADLTEELFGTLLPCPFQEAPESKSLSNDPQKNVKLDHHLEIETVISCPSCILEFDGASKGNPGRAGAGVVLRADDGSLICRLREGLGIATCNVAEYRAMILGLRYALEKGYTSIRVLGDSKLVCMQIQGLWRVRNQNISRWYEEAKKLKDKFLSFQITHVLRASNSDADAQANLGVKLADGQVQEEGEITPLSRQREIMFILENSM